MVVPSENANPLSTPGIAEAISFGALAAANSTSCCFSSTFVKPSRVAGVALGVDGSARAGVTGLAVSNVPSATSSRITSISAADSFCADSNVPGFPPFLGLRFVLA